MYYDDSVMMALFRVDYERAQALLADQGVQAVRVFGNKALVGLAFYQYRQTSIADYNEVGVAIVVDIHEVRRGVLLGAIDDRCRQRRRDPYRGPVRLPHQQVRTGPRLRGNDVTDIDVRDSIAIDVGISFDK